MSSSAVRVVAAVCAQPDQSDNNNFLHSAMLFFYSNIFHFSSSWFVFQHIKMDSESEDMEAEVSLKR